jgi:hypothetical protein
VQVVVFDTYMDFDGDDSEELGFTDDDVDLLAVDERTLLSDEAVVDVSEILSEKISQQNSTQNSCR